MDSLIIFLFVNNNFSITLKIRVQITWISTTCLTKLTISRLRTKSLLNPNLLNKKYMLAKVT